MGFFSNIFKPKVTKTFVSNNLGTFTLVYSKGNKNLWSNDNASFPLTVQGTVDNPDAGQILFLENFNNELLKLNDKITSKFKYEFTEANLDASFSSWNQRFKLVSASVMVIFENEAYWNITFEDLKTPFVHFTLYIEGQKLTDFSIDT
jgi:hypothetical protein